MTQDLQGLHDVERDIMLFVMFSFVLFLFAFFLDNFLGFFLEKETPCFPLPFGRCMKSKL